MNLAELKVKFGLSYLDKNGINIISNLPESLLIGTLKGNKKLLVRYLLKNYNLTGKS